MAQAFDLPDYVRKANFAQCTDTSKLASVHYADPGTRMYPIHNRPAAWFSAAGASLNGETSVEALAGIRKAAKAFGIDIEVEKLLTAGGQRKTAAEAEVYHVWDKTASGGERRLPIRDAAEWKTAADWMVLNRRSFKPDDLVYATERLAKKGSDYGLSDPRVDAMAGRRPFLAHKLAQAIHSLAIYVADERQPAVLALSEAVRKHAKADGSLPGDKGSRAVMAVASFCKNAAASDRAVGIFDKTDFFFDSKPVKTASGSEFSRTELAKLPLQSIQGEFGELFARKVAKNLYQADVNKLAEAAASLNADDAACLDRLARIHSVAYTPGRMAKSLLV